jgi:hypothetical protein
MRKFYKSIIEITVLSEDRPCEFNSLGDLTYLINDGPYSGEIVIKEEIEVSSQEMVNLLMDQSSDPEFFNLDENGNNLED